MPTLRVPAYHPPARVLGLIHEALSSDIHPGILADPAPSAVMLETEVRSTAILYGARFYTDQPADLTTLSSEALARIWAVLNRNGIGMTGRQEDDWTIRAHQLPFGFSPSPVTLQLIETGWSLHFGTGEILPVDLAGIVLSGSLHEQYLEHEFDLAAAVNAVMEGDIPVSSPLRMNATSCAEIVREAALFLGPIARTLVDRFARRTEDPYLVYNALATRIPSEQDRNLFLASAPPRPVRSLSAGECFGWRGLLRLEPAGVRTCRAPAGATILSFSSDQLKTLLSKPAGDALTALLVRSPGLNALGAEEIRAHLDMLMR